MKKTKMVYTFGDSKAEGNAKMKELLGGKGANLAEMNLIGVPVPPGFTITTTMCAEYNKLGKEAFIKLVKKDVETSIAKTEKLLGLEFGSENDPLLVSVRSGARVSMPGMMDTVLNLGLNDQTVEAIANKTKNERFAWDSYRRFVQMYGDVVLGMKPESKEDIDPFEKIMDEVKRNNNVSDDTDLSVDLLRALVVRFKAAVTAQTGKKFPNDPWEQLWGAISAVFDSWNTERAVYYRKINKIPSEWGTAVNVQAMVYGNMGEKSATGVAFSRDSATGENILNGEYLVNAQGEDVVAGVRTPQEITLKGSKKWAQQQGVSEKERKAKFPSMEEVMPKAYKELFEIQHKLENHYNDMQDIEFTIQQGKMWLLQTRNGKRTGKAMIRIAMEMFEQGRIDEKEVVMRMEPEKLDELLHPIFDTNAMKLANVLTRGLPASPGAATGQLVFFADECDKYENAILARIETSPEDLEGMNIANGILTARGGMTSHAAVVARGMGKCCVSGAGAIVIDYKKRTLSIGTKVYREGTWISLNGTTGEVYKGEIETIKPKVSGNFSKLLNLTDKYSRMDVRTNADTGHDSIVARDFGAKGIGLCRTEHMFFEGEKIIAMREMILADNKEGRIDALDKLLEIQQSDFEEIFEAMEGLPVTVRLLDPPLNEFVPHNTRGQQEMADAMEVSLETIQKKVEELEEVNPMLGHRGCRLGNTYPEITVMQTRAIMGAVIALKKRGVVAKPEIMIPLTGTYAEMKMQEDIVRDTIAKVFEETEDSIGHMVGTMIEIPRAALMADTIADSAEFFSFGTNDLTQMTFGYSRDDAGKFLPIYLDKGILKDDPFAVLDQDGVGQLIKMAVEKGRKARPDIKLGICGEHGGEPSSIDFCHRVGLDYVSCSPYRVPIARLAAAQASIREMK